MNYILKHFDTALIKFSADAKSSDPGYEILWVNEEKKHLLPLTLHLSEEGIGDWLKHRTIPKNRAYVHNFLRFQRPFPKRLLLGNRRGG